MAAAGFLSRYLNGSLPYAQRHITVIIFFNVLSASLNKTLIPSFLLSVFSNKNYLTGPKQCVIGSTNLNVLLIPSQHNKNVLSASLNKTFN